MVVGKAGIARALELSIDEIESFVALQPSFRGREVHRAAMVISDGNLDPGYGRGALYEKAARAGVFLYPVFVPRPSYGAWVADYFDLAKKSAGVASVLGALNPGSNWVSLSRGNTGTNALTFNFIHMARDLNGKCSFAVPLAPGREVRLGLKCRIKNVQLRLPRRSLP